MPTQSEQTETVDEMTPVMPAEKNVTNKQFKKLAARVDYLYESLASQIQYHGSKNGPVPPSSGV